MMNERVKSRNVLDKLSAESRDRLFEIGQLEKKKKGEIIFLERDKIEYMYFIVEGFVSLYRNSRYGEEKVIFIATDGEVINEVALQDEKTSIAAKTLSDVTLLKVYVKNLQELMKDDFMMTKLIYDSMAQKLRRLYRQVGNANGTFPIEKRLAARIWKLSRDYGKEVEAGRKIKFETTVTLLANMVGAKRETVSRIVSHMRKDGILKHDKGILIVLDMDALKKLV